MREQVQVRALHRKLKRESHGLTWQQRRVERPRAGSTTLQTQWVSPDAMVRFRNGMSRKEGSTEAGLNWFLSED